VVALAKGVYRQAVRITRPLTLVGACPAETLLVAPSPQYDLPTLGVTGEGGVHLQGFSVLGSRVGIWIWSTERPVSLHGVVVQRARLFGLYLQPGAPVRGDEVVVRETQPYEGERGCWW